jgi:uncharacterized protein (TIGR02145 family)
MKNSIRISRVIIFLLTIFLIHTCVPEKPPTLSTTTVTAISYTTATSGGEVTNDGGAAVTVRGVCWNTSADPTVANSKTTDGTGVGLFTSSLTGLIAGTTYYARAYATNVAGTGYGSQVTFTTSQIAVAALTTTAITAILQTTATSGGNITADNGSSVTARGVCWSTSTNPTIALTTKTTDGTGTGAFTSSITGLTANTSYYIKAYATNSAGTAYGSEVSFRTASTAPTLTTTSASAITATTASTGGNVTSDGGAPVTAYGICWSTSVNPTTALSTKTTEGTGTGAFTSSITGLNPNTAYCVRAYAINSVGTAYGNEISFTTLQPPSAITAAATSLASTTATLNGTVNANNQSTTVIFEYGTTTSYGQTINAIPNTVSGSTNTSVSANLTGLTPNTTYNFRVKAVSLGGTTYGSDVSLTTSNAGGSGIVFNPALTYGSVSDNDGNTYKTILIGTQTWMAENLKTTKYNDGTAIPLVTDGVAWAALITPGYCWYNNDAATYKATYGALYNWYTVNTGKLCPTGWHVPNDLEWTALTTYLGGENIAGGKLKETGTTHWLSPNTGATNETGFTALPGGFRYYDGPFYLVVGSYSIWWSSTQYDTGFAWFRDLNYDESIVGRNVRNKDHSFSVRCLKDGNQGTAILPTLTTTSVSSITTSTATSGGYISADGGAAVTARGVCWSTTANPTISLSTKTLNGTGTGTFTSSIIGMNPNTTYYVKAYATNSAGTAYGTQLSFTTTVQSGTVTDTEGNIYNTVTIGTQTWMKENLKTTKYNDGTAIPLVTNGWGTYTPAYCWYVNDAATYKATYGALYNWYTVNTGKLCPDGWHVPSDAEWTTLINFLVGYGGKLKETGTAHWLSPNTGATNETGFTALPGGYRYFNGSFSYVGSNGYWWSSTEEYQYYALYRYMSYNNDMVISSNYNKQSGFSVRCVRN